MVGEARYMVPPQALDGKIVPSIPSQKFGGNQHLRQENIDRNVWESISLLLKLYYLTTFTN